MDQKNSRILSASEERAQMLAELKRAKAILTSTYQSESENTIYPENSNFDFLDDMNSEQYSLEDGAGNGLANKSHRKSLATAAGRAMVPEQERGYASAVMLGIMTFVIEIAFLAITFFMYQ